MQTSDKLDGCDDPEFRELDIDIEGVSAKPSKSDTRNGREVPRNDNAAQPAAGGPSESLESSPPSTDSKQSEKLERGRSQSGRSPAIKSGDERRAESSDQLWLSVEFQPQELAGQHDIHSGGSTSREGCEEPGKAAVRVIDADNSLNERAETDQDEEIFAATLSALSIHDAGTAPVRKRERQPKCRE